MTTHPEDDLCPPFRIKVIASYKDCLTRQVSEALKIHNSKDELLNSKNEYASNHLSRIVVDMDSVARKRQVQREEEEERQAARMLESFKDAKMRRKRPSRQEDPIQQPAAKRARRNSEQHEDDLDLSGWLGHAEARCLRVGNLKSRMEMDRVRILEIMDRWKHEDTPSMPLREEDPHVDTGAETEALLEVQHQHAGAEDTHVHEVLQSCGRKMDPHVVETLLDISGLNTAIMEDTIVC